METIVFKVHSMICPDCEREVEEAALSVAGVSMAKSYYEKGILITSFDKPCNKRKIIRAAADAGHTLTVEKEKAKENIYVFGLTILLLIVCILTGFKGKIGTPPMLEGTTSYLMVFGFGMLCSIHCVSMCGGFTISQSCAFENKSEKAWGSSVRYHLGRILGYTIVGAILGLAGEMMAISIGLKAGIKIAAGILMVLMALNMFFNIQIMRRIRLSLPLSVRKKLLDFGAVGPFAMGVVTALMPCGPMQSVQLFAVAQNSILAGAAVMFVFCLGTTPLLFAVGTLISFVKLKWRKWISLASASLLLLLGTFMIENGFSIFGF